jgi:hypothetical protein
MEGVTVPPGLRACSKGGRLFQIYRKFVSKVKYRTWRMNKDRTKGGRVDKSRRQTGR